MAVDIIDAGMVKKLFLAGAKNLENNRSWVDELNVFPVPDGDTGTNMTMTLLSAVDEVVNTQSPTMADVCKAISNGSLRGARGNSGVIMSQILRGFTRSIQGYESLTLPIICDGFEKAVETAYKAVMKPKEGTILTVARGMAEKAREYRDGEMNIEEFLANIIEHGEYVLSKTPDMLPVLKEAGVVDSGGQGLILFIKGIYDCMMGKTIVTVEEKPAHEEKKAATELPLDPDDIKFGYCTEFIINLKTPLPMKEQAELKGYLDSKGDSIVMVADDEFVKIHVHTNEPGKVITKALVYGELTRMKIDNMREEHRELLGLSSSHEGTPEIFLKKENEEPSMPSESAERKKYGFIAVAAGDGFKEIFESMNVDVVISGGQTMNPCTEDFMKAIDKINADNIFIFPNNSNIIMAANQARDLTENKNIIVIPTKTVPQGITSMVIFSEDQSPKANEDEINEAVSFVKTASVTYSIRDTSIDGYDIKEGNIMAVGDKGIIAVGEDVSSVAFEGVNKLIDEDSELITVYYGENFSEEDAAKLAKKLEEEHSDCDVVVNFGGQPVYYCILSVE